MFETSKRRTSKIAPKGKVVIRVVPANAKGIYKNGYRTMSVTLRDTTVPEVMNAIKKALLSE